MNLIKETDSVFNIKNKMETMTKEEIQESFEYLISLVNELLEKEDDHFDKLNDIDKYIEKNIIYAINYDNLLWYMSRDNILTDELKNWLENYMRFYNKKEGINIWN